MRQLKATICITLTALLCFGVLSGFQSSVSSLPNESVYQNDTTADIQLSAFEILSTKCNVCHAKQNPKRVFTIDNMNSFAPKIYKQVIVKKRMPRGNAIRLTEIEYNTLSKWLVSQEK